MAPVHALVALWAGASYVQTPAAQDSIIRAGDSLTGRFVDSVVVRSPLPDPLIPVVQWIFQQPAWVMGGGIVLGAIVALPFDTTKALEQSSRLMEPGRSRGRGDTPPLDDPPGTSLTAAASPSDTFSHQRHRRLACLTCHDLRAKGRTLTFEPPRGCQVCHHQRPAASNCSACHQGSELADPRPVTVQVTVFRHARREREVNFAHQSHRDVACVKCHQTPVSLAPTPEAARCTACHENHHTADRDCATCHRTAEIVTAHQPPVDAHLACNQCHTSATVAALTPSRSFCLACHDPKVNHYEPKECTVCHLQATPEGYRARLTGAGSRR